MKTRMKVFIYMGCAILSGAVLISVVFALQHGMYGYIAWGLLAVISGVLLSNYTERYLSRPAERVMNLLAGFGFKGQDAQYDGRGVPLVSLRRLGRSYYNAVAVAMAAERYFKQWQDRDSRRHLGYFFNCADSLLENLHLRNSCGVRYGVWEYLYPWSYDLVPPWISGLAQGVGAQILSRAYKHSGAKRYRAGAQLALNAFFVEVGNGGVTFKDSDDEWWFEEYIGRNCRTSRVLNGMQYALLGIHEYYTNTGDKNALVLLTKGMACLKRNLSGYDNGWWSNYDTLGTIATRSYHNVHCDLLIKLHAATGDEQFHETHDRWRKYAKGFFIREFIKQRPSYHDITVLSLNIAITGAAILACAVAVG